MNSYDPACRDLCVTDFVFPASTSVKMGFACQRFSHGAVNKHRCSSALAVKVRVRACAGYNYPLANEGYAIVCDVDFALDFNGDLALSARADSFYVQLSIGDKNFGFAESPRIVNGA